MASRRPEPEGAGGRGLAGAWWCDVVVGWTCLGRLACQGRGWRLRLWVDPRSAGAHRGGLACLGPVQPVGLPGAWMAPASAGTRARRDHDDVAHKSVGGCRRPTIPNFTTTIPLDGNARNIPSGELRTGGRMHYQEYLGLLLAFDLK